MNRRNFTISAPLAMIEGAYPVTSRLLMSPGWAGMSSLTVGAARVLGMRVPMHAAVKAGLVPAGTVLFMTPQTARAEPFSIMVGFVIATIVKAVIDRNSQRESQLTDAKNWQTAANQAGTSAHDRSAAGEILKPQARFVDRRGNLVADTSNGQFAMSGPANASLPTAQRDFNSLEVLALGNTPFVLPVTPRVEPEGEALKKIKEAYQMMGGTFGGKDAAYSRVFSDVAGDRVVGVNNGTINGKEVLMVTPPETRQR
jgi:hypothetical protein